MPITIDGTNGVSGNDGTAASPSVRGTDPNTGMFFPAADTIAFAEGGVESMRIDSAGNIGVGTSSPENRFHVATSADYSTATFTSSGAEVNIRLRPTSSGGRDWRLVSGGSAGGFANGLIGFYDSAVGKRWWIDANGYVFSPYQPRFFVNRSDTTSYNGAVVLFNNVELNVGSCYSAATGRFTAPVAGHYFFHATGGQANAFYFDIRKNGTGVIRAEHQTGTYFHWMTTARTIYLNANDYVDVYATAGNTRYDGPYAGFGGYLLG